MYGASECAAEWGMLAGFTARKQLRALGVERQNQMWLKARALATSTHTWPRDSLGEARPSPQLCKRRDDHFNQFYCLEY